MIEQERICTKCGHPFWAQKPDGQVRGTKKWYYCNDCRKELQQQHDRAYVQRTRLKALKCISDIVACISCGEEDLQVLQIDHIHNDGATDRIKHGTGQKLYLHIIRSPQEEIRERYQILCANCNMRKRYS